MTSRLPVTLTLFRLVAGTAFLPLVLWRVPAFWLITLLVCGLLSDIADGVIARRLDVATLSLRRLDTRADMVFYGCAVIAALICAAFPLDRLWPWLVAYSALFVARNVVDYLRYRAAPSYHMWSGKLWSMVLFGHLMCLFCGERAFFLLPLAFTLYAVNTVEGIVASIILTLPSKNIPRSGTFCTPPQTPTKPLRRTDGVPPGFRQLTLDFVGSSR